jgi:hypothetical protein
MRNDQLATEFQQVANRVKWKRMAEVGLYTVGKAKQVLHPELRAALEQGLREAKAGFDKNYAYSDDYSYFQCMDEKAKSIRYFEQQLAKFS